jgi:two-component system chemotaxis response regulator CheB
MTLPIIRVLVIDDSAFMRRALVRRIELDGRFKVVDTASDGQEGVAKALSVKPDVITLDVDMPVLNGIDALRTIVAKTQIPVVMVSAQTHEGARVTIEALEIGAFDFIPKSQGTEGIHEKLHAAVTGGKRRTGAVAKPAVARPLPPARHMGGGIRMKPRVVLIGSSTGGPAALATLVAQLPKILPVPVVIAQHMPPHFTQALAKRLNDMGPPPVVEATHGEPLGRKVYIAPGGMQLRLTNNEIRVEPDRGESLYKPSVDVLAESALGAFGGAVLAVMLTGMGNDGAAQFGKLKQAGAYVIAQDQATCVVWGMPRAVVEQKSADEVLPMERVGARISELIGAG